MSPVDRRATVSEALAVLAFASFPLDGLAVGSRGLPALLSGFFLLSVVIDRFAFPYRFRGPSAAAVIATLLLAGWSLVTVSWSDQIEPAAARAGTVVLLSVTALMLARALPRVAMPALWGYLLVSAGVGAAVLLSPVEGDQLRRTFQGNENDVATYLVVGVLIGCQLVVRSKAWSALLAIALVSLTTLGLLATGSRTGLVAAVAGLVVMLWQMARGRGRKSWIVSVLLTAGALAVALAVVPGVVPPRLLATINAISTADLSRRELIWPAVMDNGWSLFGSGLASSERDIYSWTGIVSVTHNTILESVVETGVVGLVLFVIVVAVAVRDALRSAFRLVLPSIVTGVVIMTMTLSLEWRRGLWLIVAMAFANAIDDSPRGAGRSSSGSLPWRTRSKPRAGRRRDG